MLRCAVLVVAVEEILTKTSIADLIVHVDDGIEGADLMELAMAERRLVCVQQLGKPVRTLISPIETAVSQLNLLVQTLKFNSLVLHGDVLPARTLCYNHCIIQQCYKGRKLGSYIEWTHIEGEPAKRIPLHPSSLH